MKKLNHWESRAYYDSAGRGSKKPHPGMELLQKLVHSGLTVVDLGCGEGTRLNLLAKGKNIRKAIGIDISKTAISRAKKKYKELKFINADLEKLPLKDGSADLVYSAFVLEHTDNTEKVLREAKRILKRGGNLVLIAPNYGSPNRCSPPFGGSRMRKFIKGLLNDFTPNKIRLNWMKVIPIPGKYNVDYDVTVEPYVKTLLSYLENIGLGIKYWSSCWEEELPKAKTHQRVFRTLGEMNIFPFKYWGPHMVVHAVRI